MAISNNKGNESKSGRNWSTVVYPESAPAFWEQILEDEHVPAFISPIHCDDIDGDGQPKKIHYHVMVMYSGKHSFIQFDELRKRIGGVGVEYINDLKAYARYLCHLDSPHKAQYLPENVLSLSGACYLDAIENTSTKYSAMRQMIQFCKTYNCYSFSDLLEYAMEEREDWFRMLSDCCTVSMSNYLKSKSWTVDREKSLGYKWEAPKGV